MSVRSVTPLRVTSQPWLRKVSAVGPTFAHRDRTGLEIV
jgi:hypothetical protein